MRAWSQYNGTELGELVRTATSKDADVKKKKKEKNMFEETSMHDHLRTTLLLILYLKIYDSVMKIKPFCIKIKPFCGAINNFPVFQF